MARKRNQHGSIRVLSRKSGDIFEYRYYRTRADGERVAANFVVGTVVETGLRISEILALRWSDVDWMNSCIRVTRAYVYGRFGPPKSNASKRPVPLHPLLAALLEAWRNETPYANDEDFIFPSFRLKGRKPPRANMLVADHLQPAARKAGITGQVGFHTLRRTLASVLVANGSDLKLVQELLRHSNIKTTLDVYARAMTPAKLEAQGSVLQQLLVAEVKSPAV